MDNSVCAYAPWTGCCCSSLHTHVPGTKPRSLPLHTILDEDKRPRIVICHCHRTAALQLCHSQTYKARARTQLQYLTAQRGTQREEMCNSASGWCTCQYESPSLSRAISCRASPLQHGHLAWALAYQFGGRVRWGHCLTRYAASAGAAGQTNCPDCRAPGVSSRHDTSVTTVPNVCWTHRLGAAASNMKPKAPRSSSSLSSGGAPRPGQSSIVEIVLCT